MRVLAAFSLVTALARFAATAHAADPCAADAALCSAERPLPTISATPAAPRIGAPVVLEAGSPGRGNSLPGTWTATARSTMRRAPR